MRLLVVGDSRHSADQRLRNLHFGLRTYLGFDEPQGDYLGPVCVGPYKALFGQRFDIILVDVSKGTWDQPDFQDWITTAVECRLDPQGVMYVNGAAWKDRRGTYA